MTTAKEALELLDAGKRFDIIFSDILMPEMSGMEFFAELKGRLPHLAGREVFISGGAYTPGAQAFLDQVENQRLDKPFEPAHVRDVVQRTLVCEQ